MSFMEGIHIGKDANEWFFYQIRIMFDLSLDFIYCLPFKKILFFPCKYKFLNNWKLDFYLEINLEYAMCYHIIKTSFDSTFENDEFVCWFKKCSVLRLWNFLWYPLFSHAFTKMHLSLE
jgi:hypothetical protein